VLTSNVGHCLWTGIADQERAAVVAQRLLSRDMFTGFGVRTLAASAAAYNPVSYHNGSVWPHDNAICAAGLARYGFVDEAHRIITAQIDVARSRRGRLPELFAGFDRDELSTPAAYPTSCSPQAWAAAAPLLWLRTLLRFEPSAGDGKVWLDPHLPEGIDRLTVADLRVGDQLMTVSVHRDGTTVEHRGEFEIIRGARPRLPFSR
jgi:glycogen debranching enzyme